MPINLQEVLAEEESKKVLIEWAEREIVAPVKAKNSELLDKLTKYKIKAEDGKEAYLDPDEAKSAISKLKENPLPEDRKKFEEEMNRALEAQRERYETQLALAKNEKQKADDTINQERSNRYNLMKANNLRSSLVESGIKPTKMHLHEQYLKNYIAVEVENGVERVVVKDDNNKTRYGSSGLMTVAEFVNEYRGKDGVAEDWQPTVRAGGGTGTGAGGSGVTIDPNLNPSERLKAYRRSQQGK